MLPRLEHTLASHDIEVVRVAKLVLGKKRFRGPARRRGGLGVVRGIGFCGLLVVTFSWNLAGRVLFAGHEEQRNGSDQTQDFFHPQCFVWNAEDLNTVYFPFTNKKYPTQGL
jgi:hypothetical protein